MGCRGKMDTASLHILRKLPQDCSESGDPDKFRLWFDGQNNPGPVYISRTMRGEYTAVPGHESHIFVGVSVAIL